MRAVDADALEATLAEAATRSLDAHCVENAIFLSERLRAVRDSDANDPGGILSEPREGIGRRVPGGGEGGSNRRIGIEEQPRVGGTTVGDGRSYGRVWVRREGQAQGDCGG